MERNFFNRIAAATVSITLIVGPVSTAHAGLKDALDSMFVSSSTAPQTFETQRLMGVYGGHMSLRPASKGINIVQFAAPRISAGCGGIDMFFGSFSFINGEQFEQLLRSIASAAVGYAIKAAIRGMCDTCAAILEELEAVIRDLNALAKNTCATANALFGDGDQFGKLMESSRRLGNAISTSAQKFSDWAASENSSQAKPASQSPASTDTALRDHNPLTGNLVYRAADYTLKNGGNAMSSFLSYNDTLHLLMGLFGTVIINKDAYAGNSATCGSGVDKQNCESKPEEFGPSIESFDELMYVRDHQKTSGQGVTVWRCGGQECTNVVPETWSLSTWGGVKDIVNLAMFGTTTPEDGAMTFSSDSIVGSIVHGSSSLSPRARFLLEFSPIPIYRLLLEVQKSEGAMISLAFGMVEVLHPHIAYRLSSDLMNIGSNVFTSQSKVSMPTAYRDNLLKKSAQLNAMRPDTTKIGEFMNHSVESVMNMQRLLNPSLPAGNREP